MDPEESISRLYRLIEDVQTEYDRVTALWTDHASSESIDLHNLRRIRVKHFHDTPGLKEETVLYRDFITDNLNDTVFLSHDLTEFKASYRIKTDDSISDKIDRYIANPDLLGNTPLNRCLNDLCGIRAVSNFDTDTDKLIARISEQYPDLKVLDSSKTWKDDVIYVAVHIYFSGSNRTFPWELQIWSDSDAPLNFASHRAHKERYARWNVR